MNYEEIVGAIKHANLFDLYRLNTAIYYEMENQERIQQLRNSFKEGDIVSYFNERKNKLELGKVLRKNSKRVLLENLSDHEQWFIRYYFLTDLPSNKLEKH